jgi:hypothetical protein
MTIIAPSPPELREAHDEFRRLLRRKAKEPEWQKLFAACPYVLSNSLPLRLLPQDIVPLGRPGRTEADFIFYPKQLVQRPTYGVVEIKRPDTKILRNTRKNACVLTTDAATAVAQAESYARRLTAALAKDIGTSLFVGNPAHIFLIMGLSEELAARLLSDLEREALETLFPKNSRLLPYDTLLQLFEESVPPLMVPLVSPESPIEVERGIPLSIDEQIRHQKWGDSKRHSLDLDCLPGDIRPPHVFAMLIEDTELTEGDFEDSGRTIFGMREYLVRPNHKSIARFREAQPVLERKIREFYDEGVIRYGSWG